MLPSLRGRSKRNSRSKAPSQQAPAQQAPSQPKPDVVQLKTPAKSFLFVGNSFYYYNNSMHSYFLDLLRAANPQEAKQYRATSATISGSGLNWHDMEGYFNAGMASYSFGPNNEVSFNSFDKPFDVVIMNDCSQCPVHPQLSGLFSEYVKKHGDTVRKHGAVPVLFMTWAYADKPDMTEQLARAYTKAGNENDMLVVPAGLAFAKRHQGKARHCALPEGQAATRPRSAPISPPRPSMRR